MASTFADSPLSIRTFVLRIRSPGRGALRSHSRHGAHLVPLAACTAHHPGLGPYRFDGESLWAAYAGKRSNVGAFSEVYDQRRGVDTASVVTSEWRAIKDYYHDKFSLFALGKDPSEQKNVASSHPDRVLKFGEQIAARPMHRVGSVVERYDRTHDARELLELVSDVTNEQALSAALDRVGDERLAEMQPELRALRKRPQLPPSVRQRLDSLLAE